MEVHVSLRAYDQYGGGPSLAIVGDLLEQAAWDADCGVDVFEATLCFRTATSPRPGRGLDDLKVRFEADLERLPRIRWERQKRRLSVVYESHIGDGDDVLRFGLPRRSLVLSALDELIALLEANRATLSKKPGFEADRFIATLESLAERVPASDAEVAAFGDEHRAQREARRSLLPWWEQLGIEWERYHPTARELLNDPFFWSESDDYSPHGNDTGHDLLSDFRTWRRSHRDTPPVDFLRLELRRWDFRTDWLTRPLEQWDSDTELAMTTHDEAAVALAFALIKLQGSCDNAVRAVALDAIARQSDPQVAAHFGWRVSDERLAALEKLRNALEGSGPA